MVWMENITAFKQSAHLCSLHNTLILFQINYSIRHKDKLNLAIVKKYQTKKEHELTSQRMEVKRK